MTPDWGYLGREMQAGWAGGLGSGCLGHPGVSPEEGPNPARLPGLASAPGSGLDGKRLVSRTQRRLYQPIRTKEWEKLIFQGKASVDPKERKPGTESGEERRPELDPR